MEEDFYEHDLPIEDTGLPAFGDPLLPPYDTEPVEEKRYTITLADGTEISDLHLSGNNFVSETPILKGVFDYNLSPVKIFDGSVTEVHDYMELNAFQVIDGKYYFVLLDLTEQEIWQRKVDADVLYLSMMTGTELD